KMHVAKKRFVSQGIKLSAEVKPFVPKHAAVTVAWSEPSAACVFPRYLTTCYPFVQEPALEKYVYFLIYAEGLSRDFSCLSPCPSHSVAGDTTLSDYSSCSYSSDVVSSVYPIASSQYHANNSAYYSSSGRVSESAEQAYPVRPESSNVSKQRRSKEGERKLDKRRRDGEDSSGRIVNRTSFQTSACSRDSTKPDRFNKAANKKSTETPKRETLPVPAVEAPVLDFSKSHSLGRSEVLDVQRRSGSVCSAENSVTCLRGVKLYGLLKLILADFLVSLVVNKNNADTFCSVNIFVTSLDITFYATALPQKSADGSAQPHVSWAMVLSQPPKKTVSLPASEGLSRSKGKQDITPHDFCQQSETRHDASETEPEEGSEKKKKKKKKKKKPKSSVGVEKPQNETATVQEPPRIEDAEEFPDLAAASDRRNRLGSQKSSFSPAVRKQSKETSKNSGKKSQIPVQLDLGGMLAVLEQKQQTGKSKQSSKPVVFSVGGAIPLLSKEPATATKNHRLNQGKMPHNPLDSSAPLVKKGKQREVPKAKRPTPLKKIILKEREQRKQQHLLEQTAIPKDGDNICQTVENTTEDETLPQDSQAGIFQEKARMQSVPVTQVAVAQSNSEGFPEGSGIEDSTESSTASKQLNSSLPKIHSRRFRDYCSQVLSKEVDSCVTDLLKELVRFQDRLYQKDPVKAKIKRRLVMGLREVLKHLRLKKLKCVIISPNCEKIQSKGGLDETLHNIIDCACEQNIPFVFALNRKALGRCVNKAVPVSVVGIFSYDGAQDHFHRMVQLTTEARKAYKDMIAALEEEAEGELSEKPSSILTAEYGKSGLSETSKTSSRDSDEDVPNYIKIWKKKLEEEYNPYALELEKNATTDVLALNSEEH
ncbi:Selenocysteine insertion sequence-binding protein 2, partial [Struthio camelus australis]